jgi:DHA2 family multidrug resistance protein
MFADRNFATGLLFMGVTGVLLLAGLALLPPLLQHLYGYSVLQSGVLTAPRGVGTLISMLVAGKLVGRVDSRLLVVVGLGLMSASLWMMTGFALDQPASPVIWSGVVQGLGIGLIFVTMQSLAFATLAPVLRTSAASLLNLARNIGGSIGIAIVTASTIPTMDPGLLERLGQQGDVALAVINAEVTRQALFIAYLDDFWLMMWVTLAALPLVLLLKKAGAPQGGPAAHAIAD